MNNMTVRFFIWDEDADDYVECGEGDFKLATGTIEYERHTVRENGVSQICLTKNPH